MSSSSIICNFIDSYIIAASANTAAHAYRHMQLFKMLFPAFLEHCGHDKSIVSDADWTALLEFLLVIAEEPLKDEEKDKNDKGEDDDNNNNNNNGRAFKGTLFTLRYRRLSALDAVNCLSHAFTKGHRSRYRVITLMQGRVAEKIATRLDLRHRMQGGSNQYYHLTQENQKKQKNENTNDFNFPIVGSPGVGIRRRSTKNYSADAADGAEDDDFPTNSMIEIKNQSSVTFLPRNEDFEGTKTAAADDDEEEGEAVFESNPFIDPSKAKESLTSFNTSGTSEKTTEEVITFVDNINNSNQQSEKPHRLLSFREDFKTENDQQRLPSFSSTSLTSLKNNKFPSAANFLGAGHQVQNRDQTLTEVTSCERVTDEMLVAASHVHSTQISTISASFTNGGMDLWYFTLDAVPSKMLGSLTEAEYVAIEIWFNALPRDIASSTVTNTSSISGTTKASGNSSTSKTATNSNAKTSASTARKTGGNTATSSKSGATSTGSGNGADMMMMMTNNNGSTTTPMMPQAKAMITDGLLRGIPSVSQPLTVANVRSFAPRVYEGPGGAWKLDCKLLDEWIAYFPRGSGTLAEVLCFLYRDTPRQFIVRRIEGQCLAVPPNSDVWPSDAFYCGQLVVPIQTFPPSTSPPALRLSHVSTSISNTFVSSSSPELDGHENDDNKNQNQHQNKISVSANNTKNPQDEVEVFGAGGGGGAFRMPDAHVAALSVITFLRIGVTSSNRKEFLTALKAWFDACDFANLGYITLFSLQTTMMRFKEPPTSPVLVDDEVDESDTDETLKPPNNTNNFSGFSAFGTNQQQQQPEALSTSSQSQQSKESKFGILPSAKNSKNNTSSYEEKSQHYEKCPFLEKSTFQECIEKANELSPKDEQRNNNNNTNNNANSNGMFNVNSKSTTSSFFLSMLQSICDVELRDVFQYAIVDVVKRIIQESFANNHNNNNYHHHHHGNNKKTASTDSMTSALDSSNNNNSDQSSHKNSSQQQHHLSTCLQVLTGETQHIFKPPTGTIITAVKKPQFQMTNNNNNNNSPSTNMNASTNNNNTLHQQHQHAMLLNLSIAHQQAMSATELFVSQNAELHRPITFELFARSFIEVAGLVDAPTNSNNNNNQNNVVLASNSNNFGKNLLIVHPAILAEVINTSTLRAMKKRSLKHQTDDKFNSLVAQHQMAMAAATGNANNGANRRIATTAASPKSGAKSGSSHSAASSSSSQHSLAAIAQHVATMPQSANGPVTFVISPDHRMRLRRRVDSCLHSLVGVGFLLVVTNVRASTRIQKRLAQLSVSVDPNASMHNLGSDEGNVPLGRQRRSFARQKSSSALLRRRSSVGSLLLLSNSSSLHQHHGHSPSTNAVEPIMQLDRIFDPTNATDIILQHLDSSGIPIDYFVKEPHGIYRRLPALLSCKSRVFRDIGFWSSSKRRVAIDSLRLMKNSNNNNNTKMMVSDQEEVIVMTTSIPAGSDIAYRFHFEGYNESDGSSANCCGSAINTIVCGREGRKGNVLVSGVDHVTCDVDSSRNSSISVTHLAPGMSSVTARLSHDYDFLTEENEQDDELVYGSEINNYGSKRRSSNTSSKNNNKTPPTLVFELHSPSGCWSVAGFSVSLAVVSELYGAGFLCGLSFDVRRC